MWNVYKNIIKKKYIFSNVYVWLKFRIKLKNWQIKNHNYIYN